MDIKVLESPSNQQVFRTFADLARRMSNPEPGLRKAGDDYLRTIQLRHDRESYQMRPWQPLSPAYKARKDQEYPGRKILERTGKMRESYRYKVVGRSLYVGNLTNYHKYHEHFPENAHLDKGIMPTRKTLTPTPYNIGRMTNILAKELIPLEVSRPPRGFGKRQP